ADGTGTSKHRRRTGTRRRAAGASRSHDVVRHRSPGIRRCTGPDRRRLSRDNRTTLSRNVRDNRLRPCRSRRTGRDRGYRGRAGMSTTRNGRHAVILDAVRTPIGRHRAALATVRPDDLAATVIRALVGRTRLDPSLIDDVILGCTNQAGEDSRNIGRLAALIAGLPVEVPGQTVNRLCGSGLQAIVSAAHAIRSDEGDCFIAGGVESMTRAPWVTLRPDEPFARAVPETADSTIGWRFTNKSLPREWTISMGQTAEVVADRYHISREDQDAFALESQRRTADAIAHGRFDAELVPVSAPHRGGEPVVIDRDEHPRPDVSAEALRKLRPAFRDPGGTVTAGSSSGINDGAAALLVMSERAAADGH